MAKTKEKKIKEKKAKVRKEKIKPMKGGLMTRLVKMSLVPMALTGLIITLMSVFSLIVTYNNNYTDEALALADAYASSIENKINDLDQQFDVVTENHDIVDSAVPLDQRLAILENRASTSTFEDFYIAYSDGITLEFEDITTEDFYLYAINSKGSYVSSPTRSKADKNDIYIKMAKCFSADGSDFLVYGNLDVDIFNNIIKDVTFGENGVCFVLDRNGQIIASSNTEMLPILYSFAAEEIVAAETSESGIAKTPANILNSTEEAEAEAEAAFQAKYDAELGKLNNVAADMLTYNTDTCIANIAGQNYFIGYTPVEGEEGWAIAVATPLSKIISNIAFVATALIVMSLIIIAVAGAVLRAGAKKIADPIARTADRLAAFAEGDITSPAPVTKMDGEIGQMTASLDTMISTMQGCIGDIDNVLSSMADGDLTVMPEVEYRGEFSRIRDSLELIRGAMTETMTEVARSASEVRDGASQLAEGSSQLSQNAVTQAAAVDEITSTVMDIARKTEDNNENVAKALQTVQTTNEQAQEGARSMNEMLEAIAEIETSSKEIEQIMKVIDDIAFQTNILALNAAIEAARAGDAGKGFAVVADEVRNLAGKSAEAAQQTGELIGKSIDAVNRGAELANATSGALDGIVSGVEHISEVMNGIAAANAEQTSAVEQISSGMENVNSAIHNTSATAEESAAASEELSALAVSLSDTVARFRTE